ncbi:hypothetical protein A2859_05985 [Candidatus Roizmanbacteria bacterium RIFCSPHIGHO2_01_FULL_37_16b]|nr:MAG: hypothetical protein A2859_05985 [Candidatus Roizmanbacteria bacterium RIFCSPHIGHO2_01_FULL_37_16b]
MLGVLLFPIKSAIADEVKNNKFGIHLAQPHLEDLEKAKDLVNSNGGDWGYVTLVIQENDRDKNKWQEVFDRMREFHLIPIIRLATVPQADKWRRPSKEDAEGWVNFLDSLHWVIKDRYIILFNEPNHGSEWGGEVDVDDYAQVAFEFAKKLKEKNSDFFVMLAGLDASAPSSTPSFEDEGVFLSRVFNNETIEQWNYVLSGFASHSYPNPDFAGSPYASGRGSVRTYEWELKFLQQLGVKDLPVFLTETGWRRGDENTVAEHFKTAFENIWLPDERILAVTPFVLDYQGEPFLNFSWKLPSAKASEEHEFYPQFYMVQSLSKIKGDPVQIENGEINFDFPKDLVAHSSYHFILRLVNSGQAVWDKDFGYKLALFSQEEKPFEYFFSDLKKVKPFSEVEVDLYIKTNGTLGKRKLKLILEKNSKPISEGKEWQFEIFPLPSLNFKTSLYPKLRSSANDFEIQVFNEEQEVILKKRNVEVKAGKGTINEVKNVALGKKYRLVILKRYYLPRQSFTIFHQGKNEVKFERMVPLDFNPDGKLDIDDIFAFFKNLRLIYLLLP